MIDALYADQSKVAVETEVTFEDGRTGKPVRGHLEARCSGHELMQGLVKKIAETAGCYRCESFESLAAAGR